MSVDIINDYECQLWQEVEIIAKKAISMGYRCMIDQRDNGTFTVGVMEYHKEGSEQDKTEA